MTGRALRAIRARLLAAEGVTLSEMLAVLVILTIILGGLTTLFVSASNAQVDQTNRVEAQQEARLALDGLRREIHCATAVTAPRHSSITIKLGLLPEAGTTTRIVHVVHRSPLSAVALWRYNGTACSGSGVRKAESLFSNAVFSWIR